MPQRAARLANQRLRAEGGRDAARYVDVRCKNLRRRAIDVKHRA